MNNTIIAIKLAGLPSTVVLIRHRLAKHIKIRVTPKHGLTVTTPVRFNIKQLPMLLIEHRPWIQKQLDEICIDGPIIPETLAFKAIDEAWRVTRVSTSGVKGRFSLRPKEKLICINEEDLEYSQTLLKQWVKDYSKDVLNQLFKQVAKDCLIAYKKLTVRDQTSKWGSCTSEKNISLNYRLLFLPYALTRHVMIHELCHTIHFNHSNNFWQMVATYDATWKKHRQDLKQAKTHLPALFQF